MFILGIEGTVNIFPLLALQICIGSYTSQPPPLCFLVNTPFSDSLFITFVSFSDLSPSFPLCWSCRASNQTQLP